MLKIFEKYLTTLTVLVIAARLVLQDVDYDSARTFLFSSESGDALYSYTDEDGRFRLQTGIIYRISGRVHCLSFAEQRSPNSPALCEFKTVSDMQFN